MTKQTLGLMFAMLLGLPGCGAQGADSSSSEGDQVPLDERLKSLTADLQIGSRGDDVKAVHDFLKATGYLPSDQLAETYPSWRPIVSRGPADDLSFDSATREAVLQFQRRSGIAVTGIVDAPTRAAMTDPRCGTPEGLATLDPDDKFSYAFALDRPSVITWQAGNWECDSTSCVWTEDYSPMGLAAQAAVDAWEAETSVDFQRRPLVKNGSSQAYPNILITWKSLPAGVLGRFVSNAADVALIGGEIDINLNEKFSFSRPLAPNTWDYQQNIVSDSRNPHWRPPGDLVAP
ncbi:MAG: peptidoglycan-binding domain-containing protein [Polyangiaceae bacterium]|nr:peptidoglycan-binding domain-containing protein [Polyangiaceae bacterium]